MANWRILSITFSSDYVDLPVDPFTAKFTFSTEVLEIKKPGYGPIILSYAKKSDVLVLTGIIAVPGQTASQLETNYINWLKKFRHREVNIAAPDTRYDGNYLMETFEFTEKKGVLAYFEYSMTFRKGSQLIILGSDAT